ncbi:MAG TPA: triose-phosphate isomerase [Candidatus Polarisedimenticolia bacterium]|nr:triose-phosphate isomerase [Candidatus Polarisedimenticolia bacterium]
MSVPWRKALVIGNWKMNLSIGMAAQTAKSIAALVAPHPDREVAIAPPFTALTTVAGAIAGGPLLLAAQDLFWEEEGPYTGEISGPMLSEIGVRYVLVGHSERRLFLGESDRVVGHKVLAAIRAGLQPVVCVGEDLEARTARRHLQVVRDQVVRSLDGVPPHEAGRLTLAYEPIWAIGTGRAATPDDATEMHAILRREIETLYPAAGQSIRILYGGSVTERNADELMRRPEIDGLLVGGASLKPAEFGRIAAFQA